MYAKLFRNNLQKTLRDYCIYFFTLMISSSLFFAFLSLTSSCNDILGGNGNYSLSLFQNTIRYAVLSISVIFFALIRYINNYMLKQRSQEFSVYMILGMEQRTVAKHFFSETLLFGMAATLPGCLTGTLLSGVVTTFVMRTITETAEFQFGFYPDTMALTILFFCVAFLFVGIANSRKISKIKLIDLLNEKRNGESRNTKKKHYFFSVLITMVCFGITGTVLVQFTRQNGIYAGNIPEEISNRFQAVAIVAAIIGIFSMYHSIVWILAIIRGRKKWKNRGINAVLLGNLSQKVYSTAKILSISTLAITISLVGFVIMPIMAEISTGFLDYRMPYDLMIYNTYRYIDEIDDIPKIDYSFVGDILKKHQITVSEEISQRSYFIWERDFNTVAERENWHDLPRLAMSISDYNHMRKMAGMEPIFLADNEFFVHLDYEMDLDTFKDALGSGSRAIRLDDGTILNLSEPAVYNDPLGQYLFHYDDSILIFPDSVCQKLHLACTCYYANTGEAIPYSLCSAISDEISAAFHDRYAYLFDRYETKYQSDRNYTSFIGPIRFRTQEQNDIALTATSMRLLGIYSGIVFFIICMTVLALHLTTDTISQRAQYRTLFQIGTERQDITKMVSRQSAIYFFLPCATALVVALPLIYSFMVRYGYKVFTYIGSIGFQFGVWIPCLLILVILTCYYGAAIYTIKKDLEHTLNSMK